MCSAVIKKCYFPVSLSKLVYVKIFETILRSIDVPGLGKLLGVKQFTTKCCETNRKVS